MANIIGGITTSHIPAIGNAIARKAFNEPYWKRFFEGYEPVKDWLKTTKPDVAVVFYNDHGLNFFLDNMPTFAVGAASEYANKDEGWGLPELPAVPGDPELSWFVIDALVKNEFDIAMCQELVVDHSLINPLELMWPHSEDNWGITVVPVAINTVVHPRPTARRCYNLGKAVGEAVRAYPEDLNVVVLGTGGMSHQLQGERAGFINKKFDLMFMNKLADDPESLAAISETEYIREAGTEGIELIMWLAMRGALGEKAKEVHTHYHIPISNTAAGLMVLESAA